MQDSQQALESTIDRFQIYRVTVPRDYPFPNIDNKIDMNESGYRNLAGVFLGVYWEGYYEDPVTITAVNCELYIHPGSSRYVMSRINPNFPPVTALLIDRWGTPYQWIKDTFPDAELYTESFIGFMNFMHYEEPGQGLLKGHGLKPHRTVNKTAFDLATTKADAILKYNKQGLRVLYNGEQKIILGNENDYKTVDIKSIYQYGEELLKHFTDYEGTFR
jgi:hypothetical protein